MWQISEKATVKPCVLFCDVGDITALTEQNALQTLVCGCIATGQNKSPAPCRCKAKEKPGHF